MSLSLFITRYFLYMIIPGEKQKKIQSHSQSLLFIGNKKAIETRERNGDDLCQVMVE